MTDSETDLQTKSQMHSVKLAADTSDESIQYMAGALHDSITWLYFIDCNLEISHKNNCEGAIELRFLFYLLFYIFSIL